ncbi:MAG: nitroreductase family deazaflavin-dependent oxidoreductase [Streptosporangiaceae bacterium]
MSKLDAVTVRRIAAEAGVSPALVGLLQVLRRMEGLMGAGVVLLHDWNAGWLSGPRFLVLGHVGRVTGRRYRTVLEVIRTGPASGEVIVIAPLGRASHWYRNLQAQPTVDVAVGRRRFQASHRDLDERQAAAVLTDYERRHRWVGRVHNGVLSRAGGWRYDGSEDARRRLARQCPMVALRPVDDQGGPPGQSG